MFILSHLKFCLEIDSDVTLCDVLWDEHAKLVLFLEDFILKHFKVKEMFWLNEGVEVANSSDLDGIKSIKLKHSKVLNLMTSRTNLLMIRDEWKPSVS